MNKSVPHTGEPPEEIACRVKEDDGDTSNAATEPGASKDANAGLDPRFGGSHDGVGPSGATRSTSGGCIALSTRQRPAQA